MPSPTREPAAHLPLAALDQPEPRALAPLLLALGVARPCEELLVHALAGEPAVALGGDQRMQRVGADRGAPQRHAGRDQTLAVAGHQVGLVLPVQTDADRPRHDVLGRIRHGSHAPVVAAVHLRYAALPTRRYQTISVRPPLRSDPRYMRPGGAVIRKSSALRRRSGVEQSRRALPRRHVVPERPRPAHRWAAAARSGARPAWSATASSPCLTLALENPEPRLWAGLTSSIPRPDLGRCGRAPPALRASRGRFGAGRHTRAVGEMNDAKICWLSEHHHVPA